ncbi:MAG TPA: amidase [Chloroflexota bacterium]|nr:amidase [Chloroflexota bacterium]
MNQNDELARLMERLRLNLAILGISATEDDLQDVQLQGYPAVVADFERAITGIERDRQPDIGFNPAPNDEMLRQPFGDGVSPAHASEPRRPAPPTFRVENPLAFASARQVAALLRDRQLSSTELTEMALERIARHDPALNAFQVVLGEEARSAARQADLEIGSGRYRGPFHGVPVGVKDLMAMRGTSTMAGSSQPWADFDTFDAAAVRQLREGGAVIVGKTRLSEFAYSPGSNNAHYGSTANPWDLNHDTGGSSSGSGAAVAAGLVYTALGTDTGGSIRIPSSFCGTVGLKPSHGRTSLYGTAPLSWSLDHLGPMARTVGDCADLLDLLAGPDPRDPRTLSAPPALAARPLAGLRVGVLGDDGSGTPLATETVLRIWRQALDLLVEAGAILAPVDVPWLDAARQVNGAMLVIEAVTLHEERLRTRWSEIGEFPRRRLLQGLLHGPSAYVRANQARGVLRVQARDLFNRVDVLSTPTMPFGAPKLGVPGGVRFTAPWNLLGLPALSHPVGLTDEGLPIGLQLVGAPGCEATVLAAGAALEAHGL